MNCSTNERWCCTLIALGYSRIGVLDALQQTPGHEVGVELCTDHPAQHLLSAGATRASEAHLKQEIHHQSSSKRRIKTLPSIRAEYSRNMTERSRVETGKGAVIGRVLVVARPDCQVIRAGPAVDKIPYKSNLVRRL